MSKKIQLINSFFFRRNRRKFQRNKEENFIYIGEKIKEKRISLGISQNDLARRTRITPTVIEAIETANRKRLPEYAYLRSMIKIIENELGLKNNNLRSNNPDTKQKDGSKSQISLNPFTIYIFRQWHAILVYFLALLSSICLLNYYQKIISINHGVTYLPLIKETSNIDKSPDTSDLRNESKNSRYKYNFPFARKILNKRIFYPTTKDIVIILKPKEFINIKITGDHFINLKDFEGEVIFSSQGSITIESQPAISKEDKFFINGKERFPKKARNGLYILN